MYLCVSRRTTCLPRMVRQTRCFIPLCPTWTEIQVSPVTMTTISTVLVFPVEEMLSRVHRTSLRRRQKARQTWTPRTETGSNLTRWAMSPVQEEDVSLRKVSHDKVVNLFCSQIIFSIKISYFICSWQKVGWDTRVQVVEYWAYRWRTGGSPCPLCVQRENLRSLTIFLWFQARLVSGFQRRTVLQRSSWDGTQLATLWRQCPPGGAVPFRWAVDLSTCCGFINKIPNAELVHAFICCWKFFAIQLLLLILFYFSCS